MNHLRYLCLFSVTLLFFSSCEDVIELELETTDSRLVIESTLDVNSETATVIITKSNDFYDNTTPEKVAGATIVLQNETGRTYNLTETEVGMYRAENIATKPEEHFTIMIEVEGQTYEASAQVPHPATLNGIQKFESGGGAFGGDEQGTIRLTASWDDPEGIENFYRIRAYVNDTLQVDSYTVITDEFNGDGEMHNISIRTLFEQNTTVTLELLSTNESYYDYFFQVSSVSSDGFNSTTPYNPTGNFNNGALGYFGIYSSSALSIEL